MLDLILLFLLIALVAALLGFGGVVSMASLGIKILLFVIVIALIIGALSRASRGQWG